ncbi:Beta-1,4-mannooligosaccharide phosphorylase [Anaerohalosphaera lusitana]|uniref:Beta-1,4-mannooligosaccharide phosphorylase n=1 Tax=Anaerohalosphaera lusitana TaxID=1936003 RepID=A0A1U9NN24_9BACT|nr:glycoside hydrolase family 130 protein [Anaerohalosphaera lusitana]AQT69235.1 Beta-1,4-mannooligosaccharide phosphorylase [Anaerohalosphaera lusitana]
MLVERFAENPIIRPQDVTPSRDDNEVVGAFNAGATVFRGQILLLLRVAERPKDKAADEQVAPILNPHTGEIEHFRAKNDDPAVEIPDSRSFFYNGKINLTSISHLRIARSDDGVHFEIDDRPAVYPQTYYETYGLEDPRITQIGEKWYITYKVVSDHGICTGLLSTEDFEYFERHGIIFCPENLDVVLFPEMIRGEYWALTRPVPMYIGPKAIWGARSDDLIHWGGHCPVITPRPGEFDGGKVGGSCVPIKTDEGWLEIYHGSDIEDRYCLAAALHDLEDPSKVIARSKEPLMQPETDYEIKGFYGNVVFACGHVEKDGEIIIYYGASDEHTAGARTTLDKIMNTLQ